MNEIASNYAQALFSLAKDQNKVLAYQEEGKLLQGIIRDNPSLLVLLDSPFRTIEERLSTIDTVLKDFSSDIKNYLKVMVEHNKTNLILLSLEAFNSLCNESRGIKEGLIYSTVKLDKLTKSRIEKKIGELENIEVELIEKIDSTLIGGVKVVLGNRVYDGSIKNQLEQLHLKLLKEENSHEN